MNKNSKRSTYYFKLSFTFFIFFFSLSAKAFINPICYQDSKDAEIELNENIAKLAKKEGALLGHRFEDDFRVQAIQRFEETSFEKLAKSQNTYLLSKVIKEQCDQNSCKYSQIKMHYKLEKQKDNRLIGLQIDKEDYC